jgi:DNA-binding NarL/FixJ family response regulator
MNQILIADDHEIVRRGLRDLVDMHHDWEICGEARNGREAAELAMALSPEIAILDLSMPDLSGVEVTRLIRTERPETEVLIYTMHSSERHVREVIAAGARGFVLKSDPVPQVELAIASLIRHQPFFSVEVALNEPAADAPTSATDRVKREIAELITAREFEILQLLAEGRSNKEIAGELAISVKTVESHRGAVMRKLRLSSLSELTRFAIRNGILEP